MSTNCPGNSLRRYQQNPHSHRQEMNTPLLKHNVPPTTSSRRAQRRNSEVAQSTAQPKGVPRSSNDQTVPQGSSAYSSKVQIHKMTYEQVVSSVLCFLGKDPLYMASIDPKHQDKSKSRKQKQNFKLFETTDQPPQKRTSKKKQANTVTIQAPNNAANNANYQETTTDGQIVKRLGKV